MQFIVVLATLAAVATAAPSGLFARDCPQGSYYCAGTSSGASYIFQCNNGAGTEIAYCGQGNCCAVENGEPHCTC